ncbi:ribonuclease R [Roseococcus pinisoli]|uniref:Ribonuclease R n=1 Tax=Roseococcus pinisoli TaxID=2835040 RepID=A0ABS5QI85_9PROT|nr:ribonuclease R [Roseococcus pinisoli]MBS7812253.1 ribonuclease R [Roseococcus pinisoli]
MPRIGPPKKGQKARKSNAKRREGEAPAAAAPKRVKGAPRANPRAKVKTAPKGQPLPSKVELRAFLDSVQGRVGKTEIARHFGLATELRPALRQMLSEMRFDGSAKPVGKRTFQGRPAPSVEVARGNGSATPPRSAPPRRVETTAEDLAALERPRGRERPSAPERLPETAVVEVFGTDPDGDPIARPVSWEGTGKPIIYMHPERRGQTALAAGERVLARLRHISGEKYEGRTLKRLGAVEDRRRILGVFENGRIIPTDRRQKAEWTVPPGQTGGAQAGEIVLAEALPSTGFGLRPAKIVERLGMMGEPRSVSLICIHAHGIPDVFPPEAVQQAEHARGTPLGKRTDLREIPLVTIDGDDARDFDDAVFAEPEGEGWKILVAIADVAHYVTPNSALDREAWTRGNSCYFPDRVVPMLPEALSNGWCSLRPQEDRGCLFVEMHFDKSGLKTGHKFGRGLMRSVARLTYEQVQAAADAGEDPEGLAEGHVGRLYGAFRALLAARERRGTLDLDLPERRVILNDEGQVTAVIPRPRLDSHRLIEEFMVAANVCAAEELERLGQPCMYRVHAPPSEEKLASLKEFLGTLGLSINPVGQLQPRDFATLLEKVKDTAEARMVNETVLRSQSQAAYDPDNIGHFGLALARYAHFTSPIRRYADLLVHRALIRGLKLGTDGIVETELARFPETAEHITATERRAAMAERDAVDRYLAAYLADRVGAQFAARISGIHPFGVFVQLSETGASGFVPMKALPNDHWIVSDDKRSVVGRHSRQVLRLGDEVEARLREANAQTGSLVFELMMGGAPARLRGGRDRKRR